MPGRRWALLSTFCLCDKDHMKIYMLMEHLREKNCSLSIDCINILFSVILEEGKREGIQFE